MSKHTKRRPTRAERERMGTHPPVLSKYAKKLIAQGRAVAADATPAAPRGLTDRADGK